MRYKFIDLFAGIGGFRIALEGEDCECVFSSEIDKYAKETYKENFGEYPSGDLTKIKSSEIPDFDILCAGFPCQPFSIAGKRLGFEDSRGTLFFEVARVLKEKKPKAFILENVKGLVNHDEGKTIKAIENILDDLGYDFSYKVLNALDYGVPQNRERWYCVGFKKSLKVTFNNDCNDRLNFRFPEARELSVFLEDIVEENVEGYDCTKRALENIDLHLPKFIEKKGINNERLIIANEIRPSRCSFKNNGITPCLTAKMGTGGNNVPVIVNYGRKFTEKECLKIMGFPEDYKIKANFHQSYKQIGNSVAVTLVGELASELVRILKYIDCK